MDGTYWLDSAPGLSKFYVTEYGSVRGDDPIAKVNEFVKSYTAKYGSAEIDPKPLSFKTVSWSDDGRVWEVECGGMREGFVHEVSLPPLRYRQDDIPILTQHFLEKYTAINNLPSKKLSPSAMSKLVNARWDGNVRELENVIERSVILSKNSIIDDSEIQLNEQSDTEKFFGKAVESYPTMEDLEKKYIQFILNKTGGRKEKAAQILGINRRTLYRKEREYGFIEDTGVVHEDDLD